MKKIKIHDTTLRDGHQTVGVKFSKKERKIIAEILEEAGVEYIEAGFPAISEDESNSIIEISKALKFSTICCFSRGKKSDIEAALSCLENANNSRICLGIPSSDIHIKKQLKISREELKELLYNSITYARKYHHDIEWIAIDAFRSDFNFLLELSISAVEAGAKTITFADSVGFAKPEEIIFTIEKIKSDKRINENIDIGIHCHNDLGLANANSIAAVIAGANLVQCTINGLGERAGNLALEEFIMAIKTRYKENGLITNINENLIGKMSKTVEQFSGIKIHPQKPIVGKNVYSHTSGMHQDAIIKDINTYQIIDPGSVGLENFSMPLSHMSGTKGIKQRLAMLSHKLDDEKIVFLLNLIKKGKFKNNIISDKELISLIKKIEN